MFLTGSWLTYFGFGLGSCLGLSDTKDNMSEETPNIIDLFGIQFRNGTILELHTRNSSLELTATQEVVTLVSIFSLVIH